MRFDMNFKLVLIIATFQSIGVLSGCDYRDRVLSVPNSSFHQKFDWHAKDFFSDPKTIALCKAIESNDLTEIERLIVEGANVNDEGVGKMTPLMWAFPDNQINRFRLLLEKGANPNVVITTNLNVPSAFSPGQSVTILSAGSFFPHHFSEVMKHGGDPNLQGGSLGLGGTCLHAIVTGPVPDKLERIKLALASGADINAIDKTHDTTVKKATTFGGQYDLAYQLLMLGADPKIPWHDQLQTLIHFVVSEGEKPRSRAAESKEAYERLLQWLVDHGEDVDKAKADLKRWASYPHWNPDKTKMLMDRERSLKAKEKQLETGSEN